MQAVLVLAVALCALLLLQTSGVYGESNADLVNSKVERTIDLTSNMVHITSIVTVESTAAAVPIKAYTFVVEPAHAKHVAFIGAQVAADKKASGSGDDRRLAVSLISQDNSKGALYKIELRSELAPGASTTLEVELVLWGLLQPLPKAIRQADRQLVLFKGNHYYYSLYATRTQTSVVNLASDKTESFSQLPPTAKSDAAITYGPYEQVRALEVSELSVHYENNAPFLAVTSLTRSIEISHWGNIAVEETIDLAHTGAALQGAFSRFDYMRRQGGAAAVKSFRTLLPPAAVDVYYRDEIGNISTSNLRTPHHTRKSGSGAEPVEIELRPRFPLFGGWRTHYTLGYNLPVYQYLFTKGDNFALKMRLIDHIYDDQFIETATIKIILPEHVSNVEFVAPYPVDRLPNQVHYTYLDTVGRTVVVVQKKNAVENHIQDFVVRYKFQKIMILQEPLLVVGFFFVLFTLVIIIVRIDFSLSSSSKSTGEHAKKE